MFDPTKVVEIRGGQVTLVAGFVDPAALNNGATGNGIASRGSLGPSPRNQTPEKRSIPIKFEEVFYNKSSEPFRVICIEHPTNGRVETGTELSRLSEIRKYDECRLYLLSDPVNRVVLSKLEATAFQEFVVEFARGTRSERDIAARTSKLVDYVIQQLVCANPEFREFEKRPSTLKQLEIVIETWVLGRVGPTVMSALMQCFELMDSEVHRVLRANQGITLHNLNLRPELICDFSTAIELASAQLDRITTPMEKLLLLQDIIENIQRTIELSFSANAGMSDNMLASDDLIPIMVFVLLQAKPQHLNSTLFYAQNFTRYNLKTSQLGFHLVTFTAAAEFIKTDHLPRSGFASGQGDYIAHPLDPVRSPHFDPFAAGIEQVPAPTNRAENRRSMSYLTPPVTAISTGRSFGSKSSSTASNSNSYVTSSFQPGSAFDSAYTTTSTRPTLSRSISSYDSGPGSSSLHARSSSTGPTYSQASNGGTGLFTYSATAYSSNPPSNTTAIPRSELSISTLGGSSPYPAPSQPMTHQEPQAPVKGIESITLTPEERAFFANLKSYGAKSRS